MEQFVLGTAGHIDHGKSSFVKALTGTDPDRLEEEKRRGITIDLGFASLRLPGGQRVGIVDVPGHEKFIKNMVAGASGIDLVAMIIAADEGVMPQTREHLDICTLLGISHGLVVLTKIDMVDEEMLALVREDIADFTRGTFLDGAPVLPVSSLTGQGVADFPQIVADIVARIPERAQNGLLRLPVDRVFSMKGFGTVITGTLISGEIKAGEGIQIYPSDVQSKVRGLQVHGQQVDAAGTGMRTAVNFQGIDKENVARGNVLSRPGALTPSYMLDVFFKYLGGNAKALKNRTAVRVYSGTGEFTGNIILLDRDELEPGENAPVQLRLKTPVVCVRDDRIVVRTLSPVRTIGGGRVVNPVPPKHRRYRQALAEAMEKLRGSSLEELILFQCRQAREQGVAFSVLKVMTNTSDRVLQQTLEALLSARKLILADKDRRIYVHHLLVEETAQTVLETLQRFHQDNPLKKGMSRQEIKSRLARQSGEKIVELVFIRLMKEGKITQEEDVIRLAGHAVSLPSAHAEIRRKVLDLYNSAALAPPVVKELLAEFRPDDARAVKEVLTHLAEEGQLIKVKEDLYFPAAVIEELKQRLIDFLKKNEKISTPEFKEMTNVSRKYTIPLIEYFDSRKVTIRIGDMRKLR
ncbi:MAG: selenocysteine-specific translation elongation factor [Thermodesulfobacteriota bacterium]